MMKNERLKNVSRVGGDLAFLLLALLFSLTACTDYVSDIDDKYGEWLENGGKEIASSSSSAPTEDPVSSSSAKSSSSVKSSSSAKSSSSVASNSSAKSSSSVKSSSSAKSSSSVASSSSKPASSSSTPRNDVNDESKYDAATKTLTDLRDGQVYKTVTIGSQTWMAENLNYDPGDVSAMGSYAWHGCYDNQSTNCSKYGRLYTWEVAMDDAACAYGKTCNPSGTIRGVCPGGWHLPSNSEWNTLITTVGVSSTAGKKLKSTSGWSDDGNGTDAYGFSALPAGYRGNDGYFYLEGSYAAFWSSTEYSSYYAYRMHLYYNGEGAYLNLNNKNLGFSVRCVKN